MHTPPWWGEEEKGNKSAPDLLKENSRKKKSPQIGVQRVAARGGGVGGVGRRKKGRKRRLVPIKNLLKEIKLGR